jgi:hypothetical protein
LAGWRPDGAGAEPSAVVLRSGSDDEHQSTYHDIRIAPCDPTDWHRREGAGIINAQPLRHIDVDRQRKRQGIPDHSHRKSSPPDKHELRTPFVVPKESQSDGPIDKEVADNAVGFSVEEMEVGLTCSMGSGQPLVDEVSALVCDDEVNRTS